MFFLQLVCDLLADKTSGDFSPANFIGKSLPWGRVSVSGKNSSGKSLSDPLQFYCNSELYFPVNYSFFTRGISSGKTFSSRLPNTKIPPAAQFMSMFKYIKVSLKVKFHGGSVSFSVQTRLNGSKFY